MISKIMKSGHLGVFGGIFGGRGTHFLDFGGLFEGLICDEFSIGKRFSPNLQKLRLRAANGEPPRCFGAGSAKEVRPVEAFGV